jgi:hypothetical protein
MDMNLGAVSCVAPDMESRQNRLLSTLSLLLLASSGCIPAAAPLSRGEDRPLLAARISAPKMALRIGEQMSIDYTITSRVGHPIALRYDMLTEDSPHGELLVAEAPPELGDEALSLAEPAVYQDLLYAPEPLSVPANGELRLLLGPVRFEEPGRYRIWVALPWLDAFWPEEVTNAVIVTVR